MSPLQAIPDRILRILACPDCKTGISYKKERNELRCDKCGRTFPIKGGIPILLPKS